jgi:DNA recombination protein RmuC
MEIYLGLIVAIIFLAFIIILLLKSQGNIASSSQGISQELNKLYERIGGLDKESRQILELTKSFHGILQPTKTRGILGESILENLLRDILPKEVLFPQYGFKDGKKVDFVIKLPDVIVPIDAKFSLDTFNNYLNASSQDKERLRRSCLEGIKKRILEVASYVYPDEGTTDFAFMYVPSEAVYYFIVAETSLLDFAHQKKVFVVGPNTLYAYLKTIFVGFQALKIEKKARSIYDNLKRLEKDVLVLGREYSILGTHIRNISLKYDDVAKRVDNISAKLHTMGESSDEDKKTTPIPAGQESSN